MLAQITDTAREIANMPGASSSALQYVLLLAIAGLTSVVGFLWLRLEKSQNELVGRVEKNAEAASEANKATLAKLQECEDDRLKLWGRVAELEAKAS